MDYSEEFSYEVFDSGLLGFLLPLWFLQEALMVVRSSIFPRCFLNAFMDIT